MDPAWVSSVLIFFIFCACLHQMTRTKIGANELRWRFGSTTKFLDSPPSPFFSSLCPELPEVFTPGFFLHTHTCVSLPYATASTRVLRWTRCLSLDRLCPSFSKSVLSFLEPPFFSPLFQAGNTPTHSQNSGFYPYSGLRQLAAYIGTKFRAVLRKDI